MAIILDRNFNFSNGRYEVGDIVSYDKVIHKIIKITRIDGVPGSFPTHDNIEFEDGSTTLPGLIKDIDLTYKILPKIGFNKLNKSLAKKNSTDYVYANSDIRVIYSIATGGVLVKPNKAKLQGGKLTLRCVRSLQRLRYIPEDPDETIIKLTPEEFMKSATVHLKDVINFDVLIGEKL